MSIKIEQLLPLLKKGWVVMDSAERWFWEKYKPVMTQYGWLARNLKENEEVCLSDGFDIEPAEEWTQSLMRCGNE